MKLSGIRLRLATSQLIRQWAQRRLPNGKKIKGQVLNPKTVNYQTLKPEKDGLFCERLFGPIKDSICACGRLPVRGQKFCPRCEVEYISSRVRRYRLGYIQLITAGAHPWFFKGQPSYLSLFLNLPKKKIECFLYCTQNITRTIFPKELESLDRRTKNILFIQEFSYRNDLLFCDRFNSDSFVFSRQFWRLKKELIYRIFKSDVKTMSKHPKTSKSGTREQNYNKYFSVTSLFTPSQKKNTTPLYSLEGGSNLIEIGRNRLQNDKSTTSTSKRKRNFKPKAMSKHQAQALAQAKVQASRQLKAPAEAQSLYRAKLDSKAMSEHQSVSETSKALSKQPKRKLKTSKTTKRQNDGFRFRTMVFAYKRQNDKTTKLQYHKHKHFFRRCLSLQLKKSLWENGGLKDSAIYFGFSLLSKMTSWRMTAYPLWLAFIFFLIKPPQRGDFLNKFYPGPIGIIHFWGVKSRLFCLAGVQLMRTWLTQLTQYRCNDGRLLELQIRIDLLQFEREYQSSTSLMKKIQFYRRLKYLRSFRHTQINPASMILSVIPVLPPDLRPILQLQLDKNNHQIAVSDLNKLYQTLLFRNRRLARLTTENYLHCLNSEALQYAQRLLQESIECLIENKKGAPLKSLSDLFKGKKGRFRQNLLGKRVDYSGRSVIVVGPYLKIYECGLPKEIAYELFQPFLLRVLLFRFCRTIFKAKRIYYQKSQFMWDLLNGIIHFHPILLNRAPTLHRLSIQAFQPRLVEGKAILLHPLVCSAFNADFDGDQMGVHLPLCFQARAEAWKLTWSQNHLFSVATSSPVCPPSQDMILGSSFLTTRNIQKFSFDFLKNLPKKLNLKQTPYFYKGICLQKEKTVLYHSKNDLNFSYLTPHFQSIYFTPRNQLNLDYYIWCPFHPLLMAFETENKKQKLIEMRLNKNGSYYKFRSQFYQHYHSSGAEIFKKMRITYHRLKFYLALLTPSKI